MRTGIYRILFVIICPLFVALMGCGGGGGGDDFFGGAIADISANPNSFFVGDRALISSNLEEVNEDGVVLVYRFPTSLGYVPESAQLTAGDSEIEVSPVNEGVNGDRFYVVFVFSEDTFGEERRGEMQLQLEALSGAEGAKIELDVNIRDVLKPDNAQFDIANPIFGTDINVIVQIRED